MGSIDRFPQNFPVGFCSALVEWKSVYTNMNSKEKKKAGNPKLRLW